jgi:hypothetical protein
LQVIENGAVARAGEAKDDGTADALGGTGDQKGFHQLCALPAEAVQTGETPSAAMTG